MKPPGALPYVIGSDTSNAAAESHAPGDVTRLKAEILETISASNGATCDDVESIIGARHQTVSARIKELRDAGRIRDTGARRRTRSGRTAAVYEVIK